MTERRRRERASDSAMVRGSLSKGAREHEGEGEREREVGQE